MNNRLQRLYFFLVVWFTMISSSNVWGQISMPGKSKIDFLSLRFPGESGGRQYDILAVYESRTELPRPVSPGGILYNYNLNAIVEPGRQMEGSYIQPANLYYIQSGFFCKREWEFEKTTHIPFRFRLGSLADCNVMEGKH